MFRETPIQSINGDPAENPDFDKGKSISVVLRNKKSEKVNIMEGEGDFITKHLNYPRIYNCYIY